MLLTRAQKLPREVRTKLAPLAKAFDRAEADAVGFDYVRGGARRHGPKPVWMTA